MKSYDVIIAGAGPAGAVLAYAMASKGARVLLLEQERLPRYKPCGGGLTLKAVKSLPFDASATYESIAEGGILHYRGVELIRKDLAQPAAWLVMRHRFDHFLVEKASDVGAEVREGVKVQGFEEQSAGVRVFTVREAIRGQYLVGADGVHSQVAKQSGLRRNSPMGIALEAEIVVPPASLQAQASYATFDFGAIPGGYGWIFPKKEHLSVGVFHAQAARFPALREALKSFIASQPILREHEITICRGHHIPFGVGRNRLHQGHVLLVGDAAHLADPFLGEGIAYAIRSACLAAQCLGEALIKGKGVLRSYSTRVFREFGVPFQWAAWVAKVTYAFPANASFMMAKHPFLINSILGVLRGDLSFQGLALRVLLRCPQLFASLKVVRKDVSTVV